MLDLAYSLPAVTPSRSRRIHTVNHLTQPLHLAGNFKDPKAFNRHYQTLDSHVYYFKVDDDVMFIEQHAIEQMLHEKLKGRFLIVSANVINHTSERQAYDNTQLHMQSMS